MNDKDYIKDLFSEKLNSYEAKVKPELWNGIASQIGAQTAVTAGLSIAAKWIIGVSIASVVAITAVVISNSSEEPTKEEIAQNSLPVEKEEVIENQNNSITTNDVTPSNEEPVTNGTSSPGEQPNLPVENYMVQVDTNSLNEISSVGEEERNLTTESTTETEETSTESITETRIADPIKEEVVEAEQLPIEIEAEIIEKEEVNYTLGTLPNVFTPNGDRMNDYLEISSENLTDFSIIVYNDKGAVVYESNDPNFKWDGTIYGSPAPEGRYVYCITAKEFVSSDKPKRYSPLIIKR